MSIISGDFEGKCIYKENSMIVNSFNVIISLTLKSKINTLYLKYTFITQKSLSEQNLPIFSFKTRIKKKDPKPNFK